MRFIKSIYPSLTTFQGFPRTLKQFGQHAFSVFWLSSTGGRGRLPEAVCPLGNFGCPEIWSENNRKINITKEISITIDFAPPEKIPGRKPEFF